MIYMIGGSPRTGKSILGQRVAAKLVTSWTSTDLLYEPLRAKNVPGLNTEWNVSAEHITASADWFYPCLERFVFGVSSAADSYVIDGVDFLPAHASKLAKRFSIRAVFLGCSQMTPERFDRYPGRSPGYAFVPDELRRQMAYDVPLWSAFIAKEAGRWGFPYIDMGDDFEERLAEAEVALTDGSDP